MQVSPIVTTGFIAGPAGEPPSPQHQISEPPPEEIVVRLADGKERTIQSMVQTTFWDPSGTPMSAAEFLVSLFGVLPAFFTSEEDLRSLWSVHARFRPLEPGSGLGPSASADAGDLTLSLRRLHTRRGRSTHASAPEVRREIDRGAVML
jgi:hypothetical protein